jgi:hypothetical protein
MLGNLDLNNNNITGCGSLTVTGTTTIGTTTIGENTENKTRNLTVNGNTTLNGTLTVSSNTTIGTSTSNSLTVNSNSSLAGTLTVSSNTTLNSTLTVSGNTTLNGDTTTKKITVNGYIVQDATVSNQNSLNATKMVGVLDLGGNNITGCSSLTVSGSSTTNSLTVKSNSILEGTLTVNGNTTIGTTTKNKLIVNGSIESTLNMDISGNLNVTGTTNLNGNTTIGTTTNNRNLIVNGNIQGSSTPGIYRCNVSNNTLPVSTVENNRPIWKMKVTTLSDGKFTLKLPISTWGSDESPPIISLCGISGDNQIIVYIQDLKIVGSDWIATIFCSRRNDGNPVAREILVIVM